MIHILSRVCLFLTCLFLLNTLYGQFQSTPVERSKEKILFKGNTFYLHTVKQGQTLYSICKAYGVSQEEIATANPGVVINPLSIGQALKIPVKDENITGGEISSNEKQSEKQELSNEDNFYYHTLKPKETIYFLHQKYNVPLESIYKYNPGSESGVNVGQVIRIPKPSDNLAVNDRQLSQQEAIRHYTVRHGDTLYRVAEAFGLTVGDLLNANRELRWGFKPGQVILIPVNDYPSGYPQSLFPDSAVQVVFQPQFTKDQCDSIALRKSSRPGDKVAILLPFFANESFAEDTLAVSDTTSDGSKTERLTFKGRAAVELYEGFLLAIDTLKRFTGNIILYVYDTESDTNKVKKILKDLDVIEPDLIFGPVATENIPLVAKYAFERKIPFVPPLAVEDSAANPNPFYIQTVPPHDEELKEYTRYIAQFHTRNLILITKPGIQFNDENQRFKELLTMQASNVYGIDSMKFTEIILDEAVKKNLNHYLQKDTDNLVIVLSTYEPDVINVLSHLHFKMRDFPIQVFGLPQWQRFDNVRVEVMHELQVTLYSPFYINYSDPLVKNFVRTCRNKLKYEPFKTTAKGTGINYTFLGYDLGIYFLEALNNYHSNLCDCIPYKKSQLLLSRYNYTRDQSTGSLINKHISIIQYNKEYEVKLLNR
jgi:LysM repeat protein